MRSNGESRGYQVQLNNYYDIRGNTEAKLRGSNNLQYETQVSGPTDTQRTPIGRHY